MPEANGFEEDVEAAAAVVVLVVIVVVVVAVVLVVEDDGEVVHRMDITKNRIGRCWRMDVKINI